MFVCSVISDCQSYPEQAGVITQCSISPSYSDLLHTAITRFVFLHFVLQKLAFMGTEEDGRYADDIVHGYRFEGAGSAAGSVGCCSDYGDNDNLDFLNTLGPKFKTLADVCTKT